MATFVFESLGLSEAVGRFLSFYLLTIPLSLGIRVLRDPTTRHFYSAVTGITLSYFAFGLSANLHFFVTLTIAYAAMVYSRKWAGLLSFIGTFLFLVPCHVIYMSGDAWKGGSIDFTGALMILTLKAISAATDYQDSAVSESNLKDAQLKNRIMQLPSPLEFLGYAFNCGLHFAGPVYNIKDYLTWQESKGIWATEEAKALPVPYSLALKAFLKAILSAMAHLYLVALIPLSVFTSPEYKEYSPIRRWLCMLGACMAVRWKYYFVWSLAEAAVVLSGFGLTAIETKEDSGGKSGKASWDRARNCNIVGVELAESSSHLPLNWNISVGNWLRLYVYERLTPKGVKPGFWELMATQIVSAVWHGLYPGYMLYFTGSALMIGGSRVIFRLQRCIPESWIALQLAARVAHGLYASFVNNYAAVGFVVLSAHDTFEAWRGVYFTGTLVPLAICVLGVFVKPGRKPQTRKKEE